ncbi:hypothetical protein GOP47_0001398 [Adiantum capillus-veneris]|uniref:Chalcone isomerase domain-containing protein n=1 Tax=Adiantum capillus-veneris TaxID=13818 RepID=A0A9D4ZQP3_ADICA|nr:hypothetical protein GOP47_0001398 [Adiantum capillus-veneris]
MGTPQEAYLSVPLSDSSQNLFLHAEKVKEPFTGIEFDWKRNIRQAEAEGEYQLLGTAVRCMLGQCKFAKARAYAVGLYVENVDEGLWKVSGGDARFQVLLSMQTPRNLLLVMDQDVAGHHIAKGFDRSLLPRVRKAQGGKAGRGKDALKEFTQCFNQEKLLKKGDEVCLVWRPDDTLVVIIDSRVCGVIQSSILCQALFDMYLGPNSIFKRLLS